MAREPASPLRLSNTPLPPGRLLGNPHAVLLENATVDTSLPLPAILGALQAGEEPGAFIIQSRRPLDQAFRAAVGAAGAVFVAYIPNQACLATATAGGAETLRHSPLVQAVLPYEPYYKLKGDLLGAALRGAAPPGAGSLNVLLFPSTEATTTTALAGLGAEVLAEETSPFGPVLRVRCSAAEEVGGTGLPARVAGLPGVQEIERARPRVAANDLARVTTGVAINTASAFNYLGLTGTNVLVAINDSGVDASHPDLAGRVAGDSPASLLDQSGHGTHVAGIIAGAGLDSGSITNAPGSQLPAAAGQFRGMAPGCALFSTAGGSDTYLQQAAALTNAPISNNSWTYGTAVYDLAAASYDAATRDALPGVSGAQRVLFVFAAGNAGHGLTNGTGGMGDSILSPATAKNVLTIGALDQYRQITNRAWWLDATNPAQVDNGQPWLGTTSSSQEVAAFSSRGNVGPGVEGDYGRFKPDLVAPGAFLVSDRSTEWDMQAYYSPTNTLLCFPATGDTMVVLSNLNNQIGTPTPRYRYESGTSLSAACVSGVLALMEEFFQRQLGTSPSPALLKALLINGAAPPTAGADLAVTNVVNPHGWGAVSLPSSLPASGGAPITATGTAPAAWFDQDPADALGTGESRTRYLTLPPAAQGAPLRITLVWTDPPANPVAGLKLVNDLDLCVTNVDTGEIFWGNDIPGGATSNQTWDPTTPPTSDRVNNVENIFLAPPLAAHYSVTVLGHAVNVNAVAERSDEVVQDYALVVGIGTATATGTLQVADTSTSGQATAVLTLVTNQFDPSGTDTGALLADERVGGNNPMSTAGSVPLSAVNGALTLGSLSQWRFYAINNDQGYTNAVFLTYQAHRLSVDSQDQADGTGTNLALAADLDFFVSTEAGLTNLDAGALQRSTQATGSGGNHTILLTNAEPGTYYAAVKCESRQGAEYGFAAAFGETPFSEFDTNGNQILRGFPAPVAVPPAAGGRPGVGALLGAASWGGMVRRVVVTNYLTAAQPANLVGTLSHSGVQVDLNNHHAGPAWAGTALVYDDSGQRDVTNPVHPDGPGTLGMYGGGGMSGQWTLQQADTAADAGATNGGFGLLLELQPSLLAGTTATLLPGATRVDYLEVPFDATNLTVTSLLEGGTGPANLQVWPSGSGAWVAQASPVGSTSAGVVSIDKTTTPPLNAGLYVIMLSNAGPDTVTVSNGAAFFTTPSPPPPLIIASTGAVAIADSAVTVAWLGVSNEAKVVSAAVGLRIDHPRVSDLVISLVNPQGTRVLLDENRGGPTTAGMGLNAIVTNITPISSTGGAVAYTNVLNTGVTQGTLGIVYHMYAVPDEMRIYYQGSLIYDSGLVSFDGTTNVDYGPGTNTEVTIIMDAGMAFDPSDAWDYTVTATSPGFDYVTFTDDWDLTVTPMKFAIPPFTIDTPPPGGGAGTGIYYLPETPLRALVGGSAAGAWRLEIEDTRAGPGGPTPQLLGWELSLRLADATPAPGQLQHAVPQTSTIGPGLIKYYTVAVPSWARFCTNALVTSSAPVQFLFNAYEAPSWPPQPDDTVLLANATSGTSVLGATGSTPAIVPGGGFFLAVANTNPASITCTVGVEFDVPLLTDEVPVGITLPADGQPDYFAYYASSNANVVAFQLQGLDGAAEMAAQTGLPFPTLGNSPSYLSSAGGPAEQDIAAATSPFGGPPGTNPWYVGVFNTDVIAVSGAIVADEFSVSGTNTTINFCQVTGGGLVVNWSSVPGLAYSVSGGTGVGGGPLVPLTAATVATDLSTTYTLPLPSPYHTLLVAEVASPVTNSTPPPALSVASVSPAGVQLQWTAAPGGNFQVQWSASLLPAAWVTIPSVITSSGGAYSFSDDGSQTGGLGTTRFYRLLVLP